MKNWIKAISVIFGLVLLAASIVALLFFFPLAVVLTIFVAAAYFFTRELKEDFDRWEQQERYKKGISKK